MTTFTAEDLKKPPRWIEWGHELAIVKGNYICVVLRPCDGGVEIYRQGELADIRGTMRDAIELAERAHAVHFPDDAKVSPPDAPPAKGQPSGNRFAAPV